MDHTARSVAVILFIAAVAAAAIYCAQRPTIARGDILAADLLEHDPLLRSLDCQDEVPIGLAGATFECKALFKNGDEASYTFGIDREGRYSVVEQGPTTTRPRIKTTDDPWGD